MESLVAIRVWESYESAISAFSIGRETCKQSPCRICIIMVEKNFLYLAQKDTTLMGCKIFLSFPFQLLDATYSSAPVYWRAALTVGTQGGTCQCFLPLPEVGAQQSWTEL